MASGESFSKGFAMGAEIGAVSGAMAGLLAGAAAGAKAAGELGAKNASGQTSNNTIQTKKMGEYASASSTGDGANSLNLFDVLFKDANQVDFLFNNLNTIKTITTPACLSGGAFSELGQRSLAAGVLGPKASAAVGIGGVLNIAASCYFGVG